LEHPYYLTLETVHKATIGWSAPPIWSVDHLSNPGRWPILILPSKTSLGRTLLQSPV